MSAGRRLTSLCSLQRARRDTDFPIRAPSRVSLRCCRQLRKCPPSAQANSVCCVACVPARVIIRKSCPLFQLNYRDVPLAKRCAPMSGGRSRCWFFWALARSLFIRLGRRFREPIIFLATTSRHFTRRKSLVIHPIAGLGQNRVGGRPGFYSHPRS